jgi:endonuclease/exonuclease/phosphatase (EEP) superfamily protein YafD
VVAAVLLVLWNAAYVLPWYFGRDDVTGLQRDLRVLQANVLAGNQEPRRLLELIERDQPDVLVLQEVNRRWLAALRPLARLYPHELRSPDLRSSGDVILSRLPLQDPRITAVTHGRRTVLSATLHVSGRPVRLLTVHPPPPLEERRYRELLELYDATIERLAGTSGPTMLVGDLNASMWGAHYRRLVAAGNLRNARRGFGIQATYPTWAGPFGLPIDHVLHTPDVGVLDLRLGPDIGSNHRPTIADLALTPDR